MKNLKTAKAAARRHAGMACAVAALTFGLAGLGHAGPVTDRGDEQRTLLGATDVAAVEAAQAPRDRTISFSIPAGPLPDALAAFGNRTGLQVLYPSDVARGATSAGVNGTMTPDEALRRLLDGSGLNYRFTDDSTVTVKAPGGDGTMLAPITVEGQGEVDPGKLPPVYAGGQVARGSRLGLLGNKDVFDTPFNVTGYTAELMENQHGRTVADVLHNDPSAYLVNAERGVGQSYAIRGFESGGNEAPLYDGLPGLAHRRFSSVSGIERVEVFKGANSLLTGSVGRVGGTVNLVPKRPGDEAKTRVTGSYVGVANFEAQADVNRRYGSDKQFGIRLNGTYRDGESAPENYDDEYGELGVGADIRLERFRASVVLDYSRYDAQAPNQLFIAGGDVPDAPDTSAAIQQSWENLNGDFMRGIVDAEYDLFEDVTVYGAYGASYFEDAWLRTIGLNLASNGNFNQRTQQITAEELNHSGRLGVRGEFDTGPVSHQVSVEGTKHTLEGGQLFANVNSLVASNLYNPAFYGEPAHTPLSRDVPTTFKKSEESYAIADTLGVFDDRVLLTLGVRHQIVRSKNFNATTGVMTSEYNEEALTPAFGLVVKPTDNLSLYGNYIESLEQGETAPNTAANAGEVFPPAKTKQTEFGVKYDFGSFGATAGVFQIEKPNGITDGGSNVFSIDGEQRNRGFELNAFGEVTPDIRLLGGLTYIDSELTKTEDGLLDGNTGVGVPKFAAVMGVEWDTPMVRGLTLSFRANHMGGQFINDSNTRKIPSYQLYSLGARYTRELGDKELIFRANVSNLLDTDYWITYPDGNNNLYFGGPRLISVSATMEF